jgi:hypothetical protein
VITTEGQWFELNDRRLTGLAGSHTWNNVQTMGGTLAPLGLGNIVRLWASEADTLSTDYGARWDSDKILPVGPIPWPRKNGRYDLATVQPSFLHRLTNRVREAARNGQVAIVNLFEGSLFSKSWKWHAFNPANNMQRIGPSSVDKVHTPGPWNQWQWHYAKTVVQALARESNVIWETGNELAGGSGSVVFSRRLISSINKWTDQPVGASHVPRVGWEWMKDSGADWFSPATSPSSRPPLPGPVVWDSDHATPGRSRPTLYAEARRHGMVPLLMDSWRNSVLNFPSMEGDRDAITGLATTRLRFSATTRSIVDK